MALQEKEVFPFDDKEHRRTGRDENTLRQKDLLPNLLDRESGKMDTSRGSLVENRLGQEPTSDGLIT